jgi:hypothetical protein
MSSIDPTVRLSQTRSLIDSVQQEITQLEGLMADFLALEGTESTNNTTTENVSDIREDFNEYLQNKNDLSPADQHEVLTTMAYDAGLIKEMHGAWTDFANDSQSSAVTRQAIAVLKASLGALRVEESYWNKEQEEQQKMQKETNKIGIL